MHNAERGHQEYGLVAKGGGLHTRLSLIFDYHSCMRKVSKGEGGIEDKARDSVKHTALAHATIVI